MKSYSQSREDVVIQKHFGSRKGTVLSIGENDGQTLSNSLALIESGWNGVLVEPSPSAFPRLVNLHQNRIASGQVEAHQVAIAHLSGTMEFHESGEHLGTGDTALLSSLSEAETKRWKQETFTKVSVKTVTWPEFQKLTPRTVFDCVTIDAEGVDFWILRQMDLDQMQCDLVCIEFNGQNESAFTQYCGAFGMELIHKNAENLIFAR